MSRKTIAASVSVFVIFLALCFGNVQAQQPLESTSTPVGPIPTPLPTLPSQNIRPTEPANSQEQTIASLVMIGAVSVPILLAALLGVIVWLNFWRKTARLDTLPYLELETTGKKFYLARDTQILGRASDCQLKIAQNLPGADTVSYHHARLLTRNARWVVLDGASDEMPSLNGVIVNGKHTLENYLNEGDVITFGEMRFRFHFPALRSTAHTGATR
ncbi:MAG: FHA domain-containing protein [Anaerolineales bacterium]|nr:FHA domain-containing protein [Anaerolineales bacterium]